MLWKFSTFGNMTVLNMDIILRQEDIVIEVRKFPKNLENIVDIELIPRKLGIKCLRQLNIE